LLPARRAPWRPAAGLPDRETAAVKIEFVSDVVCPWCAIGLASLERALERIGATVEIDLRFGSFELNPQMPPEGEDLCGHTRARYGLTPQQFQDAMEVLRARGAAVGFVFGARARIWNSIDAQRQLHWAAAQARARGLKHALLQACHGRGENVASHAVLVALAAAVGLDAQQAGEVLGSDQFADTVRASEHRWQRLGIRSVPTLVIEGRYRIQGAQAPEVFEQMLRRIAAAPA
jgi:predicted DsbA family dithiol-disulfide isomerase